MILKSSLLALLIGSALSTSAVAQVHNSELVVNAGNSASAASYSFKQQIQSAEYKILLKQPGAIDISYAEAGVNRQEALSQVSEQQMQLFADITAIEADAFISDRFRLVGNILHVVMSNKTAQKLQSHQHINSIVKIEDDIEVTPSLKSKSLSLKTNDSPYPLLKVNSANGAPVVAIIGTGVDYTHKSLGGNGNYNEAYANLTNSWEGFPNDVVIGGFDFASETGQKDYNPLEFPDNWESYVGGTGTMAASLIRQASSNAKILAYKVEGVAFNGAHFKQNRINVLSALEMAVDPNLDGDLSDSADVVVLNTAAASFGFYKEFETGMDSSNVEVRMIRSLAAAGILVVLPVGDSSAFFEYRFDSSGKVILDEDGLPKRFTIYHQSYFNISSRATAPEAISVGKSNVENGEYVADKATGIGPTRGDSIIKPDILSANREIFGALAATGSGSGKMKSTNFLLATKVAATATSIMDNHPELSPLEVKAMIVNTGDINTANDWGVPQIGGGTIKPLSANSATALMLDNDNQQPSLNIGLVDVYEYKTFSRNIKIKNITDKEQLFHSEIIINGDKSNNDAVTIDFPKTVVLQPNETKIITATFRVDPSKLERNIITKGIDYTIENWDRLSIQGYLQLNHSVNSAGNIKMPWLIIPQAIDEIVVDKDSFDFNFYYSDYEAEQVSGRTNILPHSPQLSDALEYGLGFEEHLINIENNSDFEQTLYAMPIIYHAERKPLSLEHNYGRILQSIAGGVYPEAQCESGNKLSIAVTMFDNIDLPLANHFERGMGLVSIKLYNQQAVIDANYDNYNLSQSSSPDHQLTDLTSRLDADNTFGTHYIDLSMAFDRNRPTARIKSSSLPMIISPNKKTVINSICTNDLYHGAITEQTFSEPLAILVTTDRMTVPGIYDAPLMHNFSLGGLVTNTVNEDVIIDPSEIECGNNKIKDSNGNCINFYADDVEEQYLYEYLADFGIRNSDITPLCTANVNGKFNCSIVHELFVEEIVYESPLLINGQLLCDIPAQSTTATCIAEEIKYSTTVPDADKWRYELTIRLNDLLIAPVIDGAIGHSRFTGSVLKLAHLDSEQQTDFDWQDTITMPPHSRAKVSTLMSNTCTMSNLNRPADCLYGSALFNPMTGLYLVAGNGTSLPDIRSGQSFSVAEDAQIGDVFGQIKLAHNRLISGVVTTEIEFTLVGDISGAPFQLSKDGVLSVRDPSRLDYETQQHYPLLVVANVGQNQGLTQNFDVYLTNSNDNAPQLVSALDNFVAQQGQAIEATDLSVHFTDLDGFKLTYSAENLPQGLVLNSAGLLSGTPQQDGEFTVQITVSDGQSFYQADMKITVSPSNIESSNNKDSSGGAFYVSLLLLCVLSRRFR